MPDAGSKVVQALSDVTVFFALVLALALLVERLLEVSKSLYDALDSHYNLCDFWTARAKAIQNRLERRMRVFEYVRPEQVQPLLNRVYQLLLNNQGGYSGTAFVISGDLVRVASVRLTAKVIGMGVGIFLALRWHIDIIAQLPSPDAHYWSNSEALHRIVSGMAIGLGAGPVHKIITTIERKQAEQAAKKTSQEA